MLTVAAAVLRTVGRRRCFAAAVRDRCSQTWSIEGAEPTRTGLSARRRSNTSFMAGSPGRWGSAARFSICASAASSRLRARCRRTSIVALEQPNTVATWSGPRPSQAVSSSTSRSRSRSLFSARRNTSSPSSVGSAQLVHGQPRPKRTGAPLATPLVGQHPGARIPATTAGQDQEPRRCASTRSRTPRQRHRRRPWNCYAGARTRARDWRARETAPRDAFAPSICSTPTLMSGNPPALTAALNRPADAQASSPRVATP